ncbi:hypothetical protein THAOC_14278 [Thalassiosira oceanica]|uniref:RING-type domain-containing protein n=1 Tax=Thalassiosira oceanica TaxID=159749 RepID=K0SV92_THAOC|nr:hypothetical protein THAOC_14278 [Thalassiosira oceanica]|eukprot:EJK64931.1 hypothetical protein THAOC_14278 [Thalassiosira oceanica]
MSDEETVDATPEPASLGSDSDGRQQPKEEEEQLLMRISKQRELIDGLPPGDTRADARGRAPHQRRLGQLEFKYQMMVERKRLASELLKFQEVYGDPYSEPCLICLEDIRVNVSEKLTLLLFCCGGFVCESCARDMRESGVGLVKCPLCRESLDGTEAERAEQLMALAKRGVVWAQSNVGKCMIHGIGGFEKQEMSGLEWINKAAAQNHPTALFQLSHLHTEGLKSLVRKSQEKANELLVKSANLGYSFANSFLARCHYLGRLGFEKDIGEAYFRASVALALDGTDEQAASTLGILHYQQDLPEPSLYLACYYTNMAADEDPSGGAFYILALQNLLGYLHDQPVLPGISDAPAIFFWFGKSRDKGAAQARETLKAWEKVGQGFCANCFKMTET